MSTETDVREFAVEMALSYIRALQDRRAHERQNKGAYDYEGDLAKTDAEIARVKSRLNTIVGKF